MAVRAGRGFVLSPSRPVKVKPSYTHYDPRVVPVDVGVLSLAPVTGEGSLQPRDATATFIGQHTFEGVGRIRKKAAGTFTGTWVFPGSDVENIVYVTAASDDAAIIGFISRGDADRRYYPGTIDFTRTAVRSYLKIEVEMDEPVIMDGRPYSPTYRASYPFSASTAGGITVVPEPPPPVLTFPPSPKNQNATDAWVWKASDLAKTSKLGTWKENGGDGPSWRSKNGYEPSVTDRVTFGKKGKYVTQSRVVYFDYRNVEHMWIDLGKTFKGDFTWVFCGIILNYPTARYGHYILDKGFNTPKVSPLPSTESSAKILGDSGYRAAMLYQRNSSLQGAHTGRDLAASGRHVRIANNYVPSPRMMASVWNAGTNDNRGMLMTMGRRYRKLKSGTLDNKSMRRFVTGRRFNKVSRALASHMVLFEIRFFPRALKVWELEDQYRNLASRYKFDKYPS